MRVAFRVQRCHICSRRPALPLRSHGCSLYHSAQTALHQHIMQLVSMLRSAGKRKHDGVTCVRKCRGHACSLRQSRCLARAACSQDTGVATKDSVAGTGLDTFSRMQLACRIQGHAGDGCMARKANIAGFEERHEGTVRGDSCRWLLHSCQRVKCEVHITRWC
jgi:hypothetical protein